MIFFLGLLVLTAGAIAANSSSSSSSTPAPADGPGDAVDQLIRRADAFVVATDTHAATPRAPDFAKLAAAAHAAREQAESDTRAYINAKFDQAAGAAGAAAAATGVGLAAVPFILAAAQAGKWAASAQIALFKAMGVGGADGWSEDWQKNLKGETDWLTAHGVPFHPWNPSAHKSPMGYVNGGGGETCGFDGLCGLRESFEKLPVSEQNDAFASFVSMARHVTDNPIVDATYATAARLWSAWTLGAGTGAEMPIVEQAAREDFYTKDHPTDVRRFFELLVAAIATSAAQDAGVPFERWKEVIAHTWLGWDTGITEARKTSYPWSGAVAVAFAGAFARWICGQLAPPKVAGFGVMRYRGLR